jgi:hypothetical protein
MCGAVHDHLYIQADGTAHPCQNAVHCLDLREGPDRPSAGRGAGSETRSVVHERLLAPDGRPAFRPEVIRFDRPGARVFDSSYFADFFRFAHSGWVYERLSACRSCSFKNRCEPCPLDAAILGDRVTRECQLVDTLAADAGEHASPAANPVELPGGGRLIARPSHAYAYTDRQHALVLFNRTTNTWFRVDSRLGSALWERASAPIDRADLLRQVVLDFPEHPPERIREDLEVFLDQLVHRGFLTVVAAERQP